VPQGGGPVSAPPGRQAGSFGGGQTPALRMHTGEAGRWPTPPEVPARSSYFLLAWQFSQVPSTFLAGSALAFSMWHFWQVAWPDF